MDSRSDSISHDNSRDVSLNYMNLSCFYQNVRGLNTKITDFYNFTTSTDYDLIGLTETWLKPSVNSSELFNHNYLVLRCDRNVQALGVSKGGGALLAVTNRVCAAPLDLIGLRNSFSSIDIVGCQLSLSSGVLYVFVIYVPPNISSYELDQFLEDLAVLDCMCNKNTLIMGDFNVAKYGSNDSNITKCLSLDNYANFLNLTQHNNILNCLNVSLDLVFSNIDCFSVLRADPAVKEDPYHPALQFLFKVFHSQAKFAINNSHPSYNFKKADYARMYNLFLYADWSPILESTNPTEACELFYKTVYEIFDITVPLRHVSKAQSKNRYPSWYSPQIIRVLKRKTKAHRLYKRYGTLFFFNKFKRLRSLSKYLIDTAYKKFIIDAENNLSTDPTKLWSFVQNKKNQTRIPNVIRDADDVCYDTPDTIVNAFARYFASVYQPSNPGNPSSSPNYFQNIDTPSISENDILIAIKNTKSKFTAGPDLIPNFVIKDCACVLAVPLLHIYNQILKCATFPSIWKQARICPILKKGNPAQISNYRPIAIINNFAKIFEMILYKHIYNSIKSFISPLQHGFVEKRSTVTNLATFTQFTANCVDAGGQVDVIYTDFCKAFDQIDIFILLDKMNLLGFNDHILHLLSSYLFDRVLYVEYMGHQSHPFIATSGVPQGSNLGPLLFLIFINDLPEIIRCNKLMFADDLKIFNSVASISDCHQLQQDLDNLYLWCVNNKLHLNVAKCYVMTFTKKKIHILQYDYYINNYTLNRLKESRDLGVIFDCELNFTTHINEMVKSANKTLGFIYRNCKDFKSLHVLKVLYYSLVRPKLEYGSLVWHPIYVVHKHHIESIQRRFLKYLMFKTHGFYPPRGIDHGELLQMFNCESLEFRRITAAVKFLYNLVWVKIDCTDLLGSINFLVPRAGVRLYLSFYNLNARTNVLRKSPVYLMHCYFNIICRDCDLFSDSLHFIVKILSGKLHPYVL